MTRRSKPAAMAALTIALAGCASAPTPAHRYFQPTPGEIGPYPNSFSQAVIPRGALVVVQGDELAYGEAKRGGAPPINGADAPLSRTTISETLRGAVKGVRVENRGWPGDTVAGSAARWAAAPAPDLAILAFGYGDAAAHTPEADFSTALSILIRGLQARGATVFVVAPPPSADPIRNAALAPYRLAALFGARQAGAVVFDAYAAELRLKLPLAKGAAQRPELYQGIGADIVPYVRVVDAPQTGQAGSGESRTVRDSPSSPS